MAKNKALPSLPTGIQDFEKLRTGGHLYVDKTRYLVDLIDSGSVYFLSRPRRFGKSLTVSTLDALFINRIDLFTGLYAAEYMSGPRFTPCPVIRIDMSKAETNRGIELLEYSMLVIIKRNAERYGVTIDETSPGIALGSLISVLSLRTGRVAVLVDEYDKPIRDSLGDIEHARVVRESLRNVYSQIKAADDKTQFVLFTGVSKYTKTGVFSAMNNLVDISMDKKYSQMLGYTQEELEYYFALHLARAAAETGADPKEMLAEMANYYEGFSFDGYKRVYNPFSVLNFLREGDFRNYWIDSGQSTFITDYMSKHKLSLEEFRGKSVPLSFSSTTEIERAAPESFLYQTGYLTLRERVEPKADLPLSERTKRRRYLLDYPNREVLSSMGELFISEVCGLGMDSFDLSDGLTNAFNRGDINEVVALFNNLLGSVTYNPFDSTEKFYHALLYSITLAAGIDARPDDLSRAGTHEIAVSGKDCVYIVEIKSAIQERPVYDSETETILEEIQQSTYDGRYGARPVHRIVLAIDGKTNRIAGHLGIWSNTSAA